MKYKEAMAIGSAVDGVIKCTWAMIYDAEGNKVYSLQNRNFSKDITTESYYDGKDSTVDMYGDVDLNLAFTTEKVFESVVTCRKYVDGYRVPVILNANVAKALRNTMRIVGEESPAYKTRAKQLAEIEAGKEFWVKVKAFEWYPLNTQNVSAGVQKAEEDLKRAKQLLAASAVVTAI